MGHNGSIQAGGYLGCTGDLRSVTDNARNISQCIFHRHFYLVQSTAPHIGESCTAGTGGGNRTAEGGQLADISFLVDRQQIGEYQGTVKCLLVHLLDPGIHHHRYGGGNALVTGTGIDDDRKVTSAHPGL